MAVLQLGGLACDESFCIFVGLFVDSFDLLFVVVDAAANFSIF